jgi:hybrid cluster-associated redox disulfide protein
MSAKEEKITKDMTIREVINKYPETILVFSRYNIGCVGCFAAAFEKVEDIAKIHGTDLNELLKELNSVIKKKK